MEIHVATALLELSHEKAIMTSDSVATLRVATMQGITLLNSNKLSDPLTPYRARDEKGRPREAAAYHGASGYVPTPLSEAMPLNVKQRKST